MDEIIESYLILQEFATLIANTDSSRLIDNELLSYEEWEANILNESKYIVVSDNNETV